jgi:hypothetical protein
MFSGDSPFQKSVGPGCQGQGPWSSGWWRFPGHYNLRQVAQASGFIGPPLTFLQRVKKVDGSAETMNPLCQSPTQVVAVLS